MANCDVYSLTLEEKMRDLIAKECDAIKDLLITKNREYGCSILSPLQIFSTGSPLDQIDVRIDDKLKRLQTIKKLDKTSIHEDTELDLIGYLILKRVCRDILQKDT